MNSLLLSLTSLFFALAQVESNHNDEAVGDNSKSIGRYQIQKAYWIDSKVPGKWEDCKNKEYAEKVMKAYWKRYDPEALKNKDFERLARMHNGGCNWHKKSHKTDGYWKKVSKALEDD